MAKRKGLSIDEKKSRMTDFFHEKRDFFQLKEVEKLCQKEKGITSMSVKGVLDELVADGIVDSDKIGTSVYFWALPSKKGQNLTNLISNMTDQVEKSRAKVMKLSTEIEKSSYGKQDTEERQALLKELEEKRDKLVNVEEELKQFEDCDPDMIEKKRNDITAAEDAIIRWTDNVFALRSWLTKRFNIDQSVIDKQFEIPEDFDYP